MLTRVEITKFKSCENVVLDGLSGITALVGRNGAGKTNILQAIEWAARTSTEAGSIKTEPWLDLNSLVLHLSFPGGRYIYRLHARHRLATGLSIHESLGQVQPNGQIEPVFSRKDKSVVMGESKTIQIGANAAAMPTLLAILPTDAPILIRIGPVHALLQAIRYYPLDECVKAFDSPFVTEAEYNEWNAGGPANGDSDHSVVYLLIHMRLKDEAAFNEIKSILGNSGLGLIDDIKLNRISEPSNAGRDRTFYFLDFTVGGQPDEFRWAQLSLGTRRIVRLLVSLFFDRSSVMLIEHPEDGIHRGLLRKLIGLLKSYTDPTQIFLASHSGAVFNCLSPNEVRLVNLESGKTVLRSLSPHEIEIATRFLEEQGTLEDFLETIQQED